LPDCFQAVQNFSMPKTEIYTKDWCGYCRAAKQLLTKLGYSYTEIDVTHDVVGYQDMLMRAPGSRTVPQIFIDGVNIGGYTDLYELVSTGQIKPQIP